MCLYALFLFPEDPALAAPGVRQSEDVLVDVPTGRKWWVGAGSDARVETAVGLAAAASACAVDVQAVQRAHAGRAVLRHQVHEPPLQVHHHRSGPLSSPAARAGCDQQERRAGDQAYTD